MGVIVPTVTPIAMSDDRRGQICLLTDATLNDSAKSYVVPASEYWKVLAAYFSIATTATAGNRLMAIDFLEGTPALISRVPFGAVQAASLTWNYSAYPAAPNLSAVAGVALALTAPLPASFWMPTGYAIKVIDTAAIDAAADDITVRIVIERRKFLN